jgi:CRISPR system Cascade subunit CasE
MELYLSRLYLNHRSRAVMKDVSDPRDLHRTISRCFPLIDAQGALFDGEANSPRNAYNILHRLERRPDGYVLYVQSAARPDWTRLTPGYAHSVDVKPINGLYSNIRNGTQLVFRLAANPTKRAGKGDTGKEKFRDEKRRRIDIRDDEGRIRWLERKGEQCGFSICRVVTKSDVAAVDAAPQPAIRFKHDAGSVTLGRAMFDGVLEVTDADAFRNALAKGIGQGKAYGFGLMSVAPAR